MCEPVAMEIIAGASTVCRGDLPPYPGGRFDGRTLNDCLIAAVVLRHGATLVHKDRDFEVIAKAVPLQQLSLC